MRRAQVVPYLTVGILSACANHLGFLGGHTSSNFDGGAPVARGFPHQQLDVETSANVDTRCYQQESAA